MELTGADPLPYGIAPNQAMIAQLVRHAVSQHILDKPFTAEELFPESTHDLTGPWGAGPAGPAAAPAKGRHRADRDRRRP